MALTILFATIAGMFFVLVRAMSREMTPKSGLSKETHDLLQQYYMDLHLILGAAHFQTTQAQMQAAYAAINVVTQSQPCGIYERDEAKPDTLGWRGWNWDGEALVSPSHRTVWHDGELRVEAWDESSVVRGVAGIHALLVPKDWMFCEPGRTEISALPVHGIVERFGRFVLGREGWRAEWVIIRELATHERKIGEALKLKYPNVPIHYVKLGSEIL